MKGEIPLDIREKLRVLSSAAKFDVSCSSSGGSRKNRAGGIGNSAPAGICHSFTSDRRCISLLKTPHFAERLQGQDFLIHDVRRGIASVCRGRQWFITSMEESVREAVLGGEEDCLYEDLWKGCFSWASIGERKNPKNQKRQVPKRYWKHLTEFE